VSEQQERAISVAGHLVAGLEKVGGEISSLRADMETDREASQERDAANARYSRRTRLLLFLAAVGLVADVTATTVAFVALDVVRHSSATISDVRQSNLAGCETNNIRLARQEAAVDAILQPSANLTPAQRAAAERYFTAARAKISVAWAPKDCNAAYKLP
jgi:hypothetical protein